MASDKIATLPVQIPPIASITANNKLSQNAIDIFFVLFIVPSF
jgi:hypothetical protein